MARKYVMPQEPVAKSEKGPLGDALLRLTTGWKDYFQGIADAYRAGTVVPLEDGGTGVALVDPAQDRVVAWDDSAGAVKFMPLASLTAEAAPATGDKFLLYGAEGDLRAVDVDDLPASLPSDPGQDRFLLWDEATNTAKWGALADIATEGAPAAGDFVLVQRAEDEIVKVDWSSLPGAGAGISNVVEDTTPELGGSLDGGGFDITNVDDISCDTVAVTDEAYDDSGWNGDLTVPTKNALRDKIEALQPLDGDLTSIAALTTTAAGRSVLTVADDGLDELVVWDDSAGIMKTMPLADYTAEAAPATGDFVIIVGAEGDVRKADWSTLPGAGAGISNVSEDTSPTLGGNLEGATFSIGTSGSPVSDVFLESGAVINFNAGDVTITHSSNDIAVAGGALTLGTALAVTSGGTGQTTAAEAIGELTQALTEDTTPDRQLDMAAVYDNSADTGKKVALYNVAGSAVLASGAVSGGAALDLALDGFTQFRSFQLRLSGIAPATDGASLFFRGSDDSGATFEADASDYAWCRTDVGLATGPSVSPTGDGADSEIELTPGLGNAANEISSLVIDIHDPAATAMMQIEWRGQFTNASTGRFHIWGGGIMLAAAAVTDIRLIMSSGNMSCRYTLIGFI